MRAGSGDGSPGRRSPPHTAVPVPVPAVPAVPAPRGGVEGTAGGSS